MSRFFFHTDDMPDDEGLELPSIADAKCEAVRYAGSLICDRAAKFWDTADLKITVSDERGLLLFILQFTGTEAPAIRAHR